MVDKKLIIGLDYGTTYTGVAFCDDQGGRATVQDIQLIHDWPAIGQGIATADKVPSQISYETDAYTWGSMIPPRAKREVWTKLELDNKKRKIEDLRVLLELLGIKDVDLGSEDGPPTYPGKDPVEIVTDYLRCVCAHVVEVLRKSYGPVLDTMAVECIITVPAVWSDRAKELTFRAVSDAGFSSETFNNINTSMIAEPEAAAIYTLKTVQRGGIGSDIKPGDVFVLCDAGGGTVDLVSYRVRTVEPNFSVEEAAVGSGDKCGASFVDRNFIEWFKEKVGEDNYNSIPTDQVATGSRLMTEFEAAKMKFTGESTTIFLALPRALRELEDDPSKGIEEGELKMTESDLAEMFAPCVDRTLELIQGQLDEVDKTGQQVKYVFLVGGFGRSVYLYKKVEEFCKGRGLDAITPPFPWSAVVRGAVARGLEGKTEGLIHCRKLRRHYGTPVSMIFDHSEHLQEDAYIDELTGEKYARGQMKWMATRGDSILADVPRRVHIECCRTFKKEESRIFSARLAACDSETGPVRYAEDSVYNVGVLHADLTSVPDSQYMIGTRGIGTEPFFIAEFRIEIEITDRLRFFLTFKGKEYGSVTMDYDG